MTPYRVRWTEKRTCEVTVKAYSEDDAIDAVYAGAIDIDDLEVVREDITEIDAEEIQ